MMLVYAILVPAVWATSCPLWGPLLPRVRRPFDYAQVSNANEHLTNLLDQLVAGKLSADFSPANLSFSIGLVSLDSPDPFWEYHWVATNNVEGTKASNGDSQFMIGSISKVCAVTVVNYKMYMAEMSRNCS
jgi:hypothetical protein